jgi:Na+(H+)/acetate symporter ActP
MQASSDLSILDFDIPFSIVFFGVSAIELLTMIGIMAAVTWQVLIVAGLTMVAVTYLQVKSIFQFRFLQLFLASSIE